MEHQILTIDTSVISHNARALKDAGAKANVDIVGVLKGVLSDAEIARVFLEAGITTLADSDAGRLCELRKTAGPASLMMLRQPLPSEIEDVAEVADIVLLWEEAAARALGKAAREVRMHAPKQEPGSRRTMRVMLSVDAGFGREGAMPSQLPNLVRVINSLDDLELAGVAITLNCDLAERDKVREKEQSSNLEVIDKFLKLVGAVEKAESVSFEVRSGGNSGAVQMLLTNKLPGEIDQLRLGDSILFGRDTVTGAPLSGLKTGAFAVHARVLGRRASADATDIVLAIGKHDLGAGSVHIDPGLLPVAGILHTDMTSDHFIVRCTNTTAEALFRDSQYGAMVTLYPDYYGLLGLLTRGRIRKQFC